MKKKRKSVDDFVGFMASTEAHSSSSSSRNNMVIAAQSYTRHLEDTYGGVYSALEDGHLDQAIEEKLEGRCWQSPYLPSSVEGLMRFFSFAEVTSADVIADIGCGDGRVLLAAAKVLGCRGVGVDVSSECVSVAREIAAKEGVGQELVTWSCTDVTSLDPSNAAVEQLLATATVIYLYIYPTLVDQVGSLVRRLCSREGVRVFTLRYHLPAEEWAHVKASEDPPMRLYDRSSIR